MSREQFQPEWVSIPGDTLARLLESRRLTVGEFARELGQEFDVAEGLLHGRVSITLAIARRLEEIVGGSVQFWMSRDFQYRDEANRLAAASEAWVTDLPLGDMVKYGWLKQKPRLGDELSASLSFFGVTSVAEWHRRYSQVEELATFRTSPSFDSKPAAVAAWIRQGEVEADGIVCRPWDPNKFRSALIEIRALTRLKNPENFIPKLRDLCAAAGVAIVILRAPTGCRASGATRFISREKALLLLSFRHLTDDQFWFTVFHEAAHLLLHSKNKLFVDGIEQPSSLEEEEANEFAAITLIPQEFQAELRTLPLNTLRVIRFAGNVGVSPGIVVGQLQHLGLISHDQLNRLKRRYRWVN